MQPAPRQLVCDICGDELDLLYKDASDPISGHMFDVGRCPSCDYAKTLSPPDDLAPYYGKVYYNGRHGLTERMCMRRRIGFLQALTSPGRLLDFGCGDGGFLVAAKEHGWDVKGVEIEAQAARARGLSVTDTIQEAGAPFDAITLWHSLEHVHRPKDVVAELVGHLDPRGTLFIAVPNLDSLQARVFGKDWFHLDVPRHLSHFTPRSLRRLLDDLGLDVAAEWNLEMEIDWFGWPQSMLNKILTQRNVLFDMVTHRPRPHSTADAAISLALGGAMAAASLPVVPLAAAAGKGAILVMAARPRASRDPALPH